MRKTDGTSFKLCMDPKFAATLEPKAERKLAASVVFPMPWYEQKLPEGSLRVKSAAIDPDAVGALDQQTTAFSASGSMMQLRNAPVADVDSRGVQENPRLARWLATAR